MSINKRRNIFMSTIQQCRQCLNTTQNPSIRILENGLCNVCNSFQEHYDPSYLDEEVSILKNYVRKNKADSLIALSGGKDSTAMIQDALALGFHPTAFSFQARYNNLNEKRVEKIHRIARKMGLDYEVIDAIPYITKTDSANFQAMSDFYDAAVRGEISHQDFLDTYKEGRLHYSTKDDTVCTFVRPCQACRKVAIKAYYGEAIKHNVSVVFVGINEWAALTDGRYSAIRRLKPFADQAEVLIVHLPFLMRRKYSELKNKLKEMNCLSDVEELGVETGGKCCPLANACEKIAYENLGFHLDSTRLSREITVGFIDKGTALNAVKKGLRDSKDSVHKILVESGILEL